MERAISKCLDSASPQQRSLSSLQWSPALDEGSSEVEGRGERGKGTCGNVVSCFHGAGCRKGPAGPAGCLVLDDEIAQAVAPVHGRRKRSLGCQPLVRDLSRVLAPPADHATGLAMSGQHHPQILLLQITNDAINKLP